MRSCCSDSVPHDPVDMASGFRHLLVLLGVGIDELLRRGLDTVPAVKPSAMDAAFKWGMECPDCIYVGSALNGAETYRLWGNRGSARYVGLQIMSGMASTFNALIDEFELGPDGEFEVILSAEPHDGNWIPLEENTTMLVIRHFFYDWETGGCRRSVDRAAVGQGSRHGGRSGGSRGRRWPASSSLWGTSWRRT